MAQPHKGVRIQQTLRLPAALHRAAVGEARRKRWSLNDYITSCVERCIEQDQPVPVQSPVGERQNLIVYDDDGAVMGVV